ncbi:hypothetical protein DZC30_17655 [Comamonas testosteroni]|uniref:Uncharacterized protein n=1 Tax=Comamonas testosteroni TaxID=285 RepID=A0A373FCB5_COMTE|nr:hypothetical protein [Comamonas testosteroni]RGE41811.1 hypothetical protein DZC30_17655 [Comamonas testosteroni]
MILQKTAKAQQELQPGSRQLPQRARSVLLMAGGKSLDEIHNMLGSDHAAVARQLVEQGYLQLMTASTGKPSQTPHAPQPPQMAGAAPIQLAPAQALAAPTAATSSESPNINMAGTRMYLFDMCERLFANRHEALAQALREQLRQARDLDSLREAGLALLTAVEQHAGEERAQSLRERLAALLAHHTSEEVAA